MEGDKEHILKLKQVLESGESVDRVLRALKRLNHFHMTVELLQSTGIGKAVNNFRKNEQVGSYAKALVQKWKQDVAKVIAETAEAEVTSSRKRSVSPDAEPSPKRARKTPDSDNDLPSFEDCLKSSDTKRKSEDHRDNKHKSHQSDKPEKSHKSDRHDKSHSSDKHDNNSSREHKSREDSKSKSSRYDREHHSSRDKSDSKESREKSRHSESSKSKHSESSREKAKHSESSREKSKESSREKSSSTSRHHESSRDKSDKYSKEKEHSSKHSEPSREKKHNSDSHSSKHRHSESSHHKDKERSKHSDSREKKHGESSKGAKDSKSFDPFSAGDLSSSSGSDSKRPKKERRSTLPTFDIPAPPQVGLKEVDILASLPQTITNYKPLPHINHDSPTKRRIEEEIGTKKHSRSVMYSGRKTRTVSEVPKLFDACMEVLMDNIDSIDDVGGIPYFVLKPLLAKCTSEQLFNIENMNTHLLEDTDELWHDHCKKDFRGKERNIDDCETWRELYLRLHEERERKLKKLTANISAQHQTLKDAGRKTKMAFVDVIAKPPRDVLRRQKMHGTGGPVHKTVDPLEKLSSRGGEAGKSSIRAPILQNQVTNHVVSPPAVRPAAAGKKKVAPRMANVKKLMKSMRR